MTEDNPIVIKNYSAKAQCAKILKYLKEEGGLSTLDAREKLGIMSPAARIFELKEGGYPIVTVWMIEHDVTGTPHRIAKYILLIGELADSYRWNKQKYQLKKRLLSEPVEQKAKKEAAQDILQDIEGGSKPSVANPTDEQGDSQTSSELDE